MANQKTVLLCDADAAALSQIAAELEQYGFEAATLQDATGIVSAVQQRAYAVVVANPDMKGFNDYEVCKYVKQEAGVPVVLLLEPGSTARNTIDACAADDVVTKPVDTADLANLLNKHYTLSKAGE